MYAVRKFMLPKTNPGVREIRDYKHYDAELFAEDLSRIPCGERDSIIPTHVGMFGNSFLLKH